MMYRAIASFSGVVSAVCGEVMEINDLSIADDLLNAGYIEKIEPEKPSEKPKERKPRKRNLRKENKNESDFKSK